MCQNGRSCAGRRTLRVGLSDSAAQLSFFFSKTGNGLTGVDSCWPRDLETVLGAALEEAANLCLTREF